jgi:microcystin-dependent protein
MEPFLGQLILVPYDFAPNGWALCNGQLLSIAQNQALFALLGTTYGGDGVNTFALPDLRGRVPVSFGQGPGLSSYILGETYGAESVTLNTTQTPSHTHSVNCDSARGNEAGPTGRYPAEASHKIYAGTANAQMNAGMIGDTGGGAAHDNRQPSLVLNWIIALQGVFPARP